MKNLLTTLVILFSINACGTISTVPKKAQLKLKHSSMLNKNPCKKIPRVYSGVLFNGCLMFGPPNPYIPAMDLHFHIADTIASLLADTIVLPYTIYGQSKYGNIPISQNAAN